MDHTLYLTEFFGVVDRMDAETFAEYFDPAGSFRFANQAPAEGRGAIRALAQGVFDQLNGIGHRVVNVAANEKRDLLVEGIVTYHRRDGKTVELPFACAFEFEPGSSAGSAAGAGKSRGAWPFVKRYRSYIDIAPLLA